MWGRTKAIFRCARDRWDRIMRPVDIFFDHLTDFVVVVAILVIVIWVAGFPFAKVWQFIREVAALIFG